eukprot:symbB.v1.2.026978.t1/scaffold2687.1/size73039/8
MSIWWRIFITARLQTEEAQTWCNQQLAPQQFGCRRKRDALSAVVALTEAQTKGHFLATLDLSQAFDRIRPQRALDTLKHYGFPQKLAAAVAGLWFNQQRILMWNQCCRQSITVVNASIPQGDSLSPWAMNLMLTGPTACVAQQYPNSTQIVYVDDRSFAAPTVQMLRNVWASWQEHTAALGFKENISKTQAFARSAKRRRALLAHPDFAPYATDDFTVLGVSFRLLAVAPCCVIVVAWALAVLLDDGFLGLSPRFQDPKVKAYFQTLDVDVHEGTELFYILDNGDGEVTLDEFINGILRCKGQARAIDQLAMHADVRQLSKKILRLERTLNPLARFRHARAMVQTPGGDARMGAVVELVHVQHAELTRLLQLQLVNLEVALQGAIDLSGVASQDVSQHRLSAIFEVAGDSRTSSEPLNPRRHGPPRQLPVHPVCIALGESPGKTSLEVGQISHLEPSMESVQFFANQLANEKSIERSYDICSSPPQEDSGFSRNSFKEQLVLPADASQKIVYELEEKKRNSMENDDRPSLAQKSKELARRPRPISKASLASGPEEDEERHPYLRQWGNRLATACVFLNAVVLLCELEFIGEYNGFKVQPSLPDMSFFASGPGDADILLNGANICRELDMAFCFIFMVEVAFRIYIERWNFPKEIANWIDTVLAIVGLVDIIIFFQAAEEEAAFLKGLKALRSIRLLRYFRFIDGIRLLFQACQAFLPSLFWSMILLAVFMFVAALTISHLLQGFIDDPSQILEDRIWIWEHYGTAYRSAYTIYECTFAGNWPTYARPVLTKVSHWFSIFFMTYITLIAFALIRVITAVILKDTLDAAQSDAEHQVIERLQKKAEYVEKLEKVFTKLDESGEGLITEAHLNQMLLDPKVKAYFQTLDVDVHEGTALFHILDNGDGEVTLDEFINGILRCKGPARAIDQLAMHADVRQLTKKLLRLERAVNPLGLVSPSASIPKSRGSRGSAQSEYLKAFRRKSDNGDLSESPSRWGRVSRVMTAS